MVQSSNRAITKELIMNFRKKSIMCICLLCATLSVFSDEIYSQYDDIDMLRLLNPTYTIKAGTHTADQNAAHQKFCSQFGDKDITDTIDIQVGYDNYDPMDETVFCSGSGSAGGGFAGAGAS